MILLSHKPLREERSFYRISRERRKRVVQPMTLAIGALCDVNGYSQTGAFVIGADTLVSYGDASSNERASKLYQLPHGFFCLIAGDISKAHEFVGRLHTGMDLISSDGNEFIEPVKKCLDNSLEYVRFWTRKEILAEACITTDEFLHDRNLQGREELEERLKEANFSFRCILAGFAPHGTPVLFEGDCLKINEHASPGFVCIGTGAEAATDWLNFRKQHSFMSPQRTYYHVREALDFGRLSPFVGNTVNMQLLRHGKPPCDVANLNPLLQEWVKAHYPRTTDDLDQPQAWRDFAATFGIPASRLSESQTSAGPP